MLRSNGNSSDYPGERGSSLAAHSGVHGAMWADPFPAAKAVMPGGGSSGCPQVARAAMSLPDPVRGGISHALALIRTRYEGNEDPAYNMPFHCVAHTVGVL